MSAVPISPAKTISIVSAGHPDPSSIEALRSVFDSIELVETNLDHLRPFPEQGGAANRAIDAAQDDWILLLRQHEKVSEALAREISESIGTSPRAWGYRLASSVSYAGQPLRLERGRDSELRLLHRRHARFKEGREFVQGTVVRMKHSLVKESFGSSEEHEAYLKKTAVPHSLVRTTLIFLKNTVLTRAFFRSNDLRYLWIEAKYDHENQTSR